MRTPTVMMFIAAAALATHADARGRGGGKSYSSPSSYSSSYKPSTQVSKGKRCGNSYIAADKTCHAEASYAGTAAAAVAGAGAVAWAGTAAGDAFSDNARVQAQDVTPTAERLQTAQALTDAAFVMDLPSQSAGKVRRLKMNELVTVHEVLGDWVRISPATISEEWVKRTYISSITP